MLRAFLTMVFLSLTVLSSAYGEEWVDQLKEFDIQTEQVLQDTSTAKHFETDSSPIVKEGEELVDLTTARALARVDDVDKKVQALERQVRLQDEQISRLDRSINDLKRRR